MRKIMGKRLLATAVAMTALLSGCGKDKYIEQLYTDELATKIESENTEKAMDWFAEHVPDAENISVSPYQFLNKISSDVVTGNYRKNGIIIEYYLNVENGSCITKEHEKEFNDSLSEKIAAQLGLSFANVVVVGVTDSIEGTKISELDEKGKLMEEPQYEEFSCGPNGFLDWDINSEEIEKLTDEIADSSTQRPAYVTVRLGDVDKILELFEDFSFAEEHPNYVIKVIDNDDKDDAVEWDLEVEDGNHILRRWSIDRNDNRVSEIYAKKPIEEQS